jgi:hypothetical protein
MKKIFFLPGFCYMLGAMLYHSYFKSKTDFVLEMADIDAILQYPTRTVWAVSLAFWAIPSLFIFCLHSSL